MSDFVREYLRLVAADHIDTMAPEKEQTRRDHAKQGLWEAMGKDERDEANQLVEDIFGEWLDED